MKNITKLFITKTRLLAVLTITCFSLGLTGAQAGDAQRSDTDNNSNQERFLLISFDENFTGNNTIDGNRPETETEILSEIHGSSPQKAKETMILNSTPLTTPTDVNNSSRNSTLLSSNGRHQHHHQTRGSRPLLNGDKISERLLLSNEAGLEPANLHVLCASIRQTETVWSRQSGVVS